MSELSKFGVITIAAATAATPQSKAASELWLRTGGVSKDYLRTVLGGTKETVTAISPVYASEATRKERRVLHAEFKADN